jgi:hypothetical protein
MSRGVSAATMLVLEHHHAACYAMLHACQIACQQTHCCAEPRHSVTASTCQHAMLQATVVQRPAYTRPSQHTQIFRTATMPTTHMLWRHRHNQGTTHTHLHMHKPCFVRVRQLFGPLRLVTPCNHTHQANARALNMQEFGTCTTSANARFCTCLQSLTDDALCTNSRLHAHLCHMHTPCIQPNLFNQPQTRTNKRTQPQTPNPMCKKKPQEWRENAAPHTLIMM